MGEKLNKKIRIYLIVTVLSFILVSAGITMAYFMASVHGTGTANLNVTLSDNPNLTFTKGNDIALNVDFENFQDGGADIFGTTTSSATLEADGTEVSTKYNAYFHISKNDIDYSIDNLGKEAELVLVITITDGAGNSDVVVPEGYEVKLYTVTNSDGTTKKVHGIDITGVSGLLKVGVDYNLTVPNGNNNHTQKWDASIYFMNLDVNQIENAGKSFNARFILGLDKLSVLSDTILINNAKFDAEEEATIENAKHYISNKTIDPSNNDGMFATTESYKDKDDMVDSGETYYFRGAVNNNWVKFGGFYWRIIRIDKDGNIKMIYSGKVDEPGKILNDGTMMTGSETGIKSTQFNTTFKKYYDVGYMYSVSSLHGCDNVSNIKIKLDEWYAQNLSVGGYEEYITETTYCVDRQGWDSINYDKEYSDTESILKDVHYGAYRRLVSNQTPSLNCENQSDVFTDPVTLISADEVALAGGNSRYGNSKYYLYTNTNYWTISPYHFYNNTARVFRVTSSGRLLNDAVSSIYSEMRPVISLSSANLFISGNGGYGNEAYIVV